MEDQDLQAHKEREDLLELKAQRVIKDQPVPLDLVEREDHLGLLGLQDQLVLQEKMVEQDHKVKEEMQVILEIKEDLASKEVQVL